jgi:type I restriction enzyme, R subunit
MRVMKERLKSVKKTNMTVSKGFSQRFETILERYLNRDDDLDEVYEVFEELIDELEAAIQEGTQLDLSYEEKAFFDVLGPIQTLRS